MRKKLTKISLTDVLICAVLLILAANTEVDLIVNGKFETTTCSSITANYLDCQKSDAINGWTAKYISDSSDAPISVQAKTGFKTIPSDVSNIVPLDIYDSSIGGARKYRRTCIYQNLSPVLEVGAYTFRWGAATRDGLSDSTYKYFDYRVGIMNADGSAGAVEDIPLSWTGFGSHVRNYHF